MANSDKNIVIRPSIGSTIDQPSITFTGAGNTSITLKVLDDAEGTLSFEGYQGQVFAVNTNLSSGIIYSVNDISGLPLIDANADGTIRLGIYTGNIGIGVTNPSQKFQIGAANTLGISTDGQIFVITSNEDVGIGTTRPTSKLHVVGNAVVTGVVTASGGVQGIGIYSGGNLVTTGIITALNFVGTGNTFSVVGNRVDISISGSGGGSGSVSISTNTTNSNQFIPYVTSLGSTTGFGATTLLVYNPSSGNLGIGSTSPTSTLDIIGALKITGVSTFTNTTDSSSTTTGALIVSGGVGVARNVFVGAGLSVVGVSTFAGITTVTGTTLFSRQLNVSGVATVNSNFTVNGNTLVVDATNNRIGIGTTNPLHPLQVGTGSSIVIIDSLGDVGIGTTNATSKLYVSGDGFFSGVVTTSGLSAISAGTTIFSVGVGTTTSTGSIFSVTDFTDAALIDVRTDNDVLFTPTSNGYVGVGTTNATQPFDVNVTSRFVGDVRVAAAGTSSYYKINYNTTSQTLDFTFITS